MITHIAVDNTDRALIAGLLKGHIEKCQSINHINDLLPPDFVRARERNMDRLCQLYEQFGGTDEKILRRATVAG